MRLEVHDDFLPPRLFEDLRSRMFGGTMPWFHQMGTVHYDTNIPNVRDSMQFTHVMYGVDIPPTSLLDLNVWIALIEKACSVEVVDFYRVKANLLIQEPNYPKGFTNVPHPDWSGPNNSPIDGLYTFLYYLNDSDGDTVIFNELGPEEPTNFTEFDRVTPKANRGILFDSNYYHASSPPISTATRVVINFVFKAKTSC